MSDTTNPPANRADAGSPINPSPGGRPVFEPSHGLTGDQLASGANTLAKYWTGDPTKLQEALAGMGLAQTEVPGASGREAMFRSQATDIDDTRFAETFAPATAADYDLNGLFVGRTFDAVEGLDPAAAPGALNEMLRGAMAAMELPRIVGRGFAESVLDAAAGPFKEMDSQTARDLYSQDQIAMAIRATGAASREDLMKTAKVAVDRLDPETAKAWADAGVFESGNVLAQLYRQGQRIAARGSR